MSPSKIGLVSPQQGAKGGVSQRDRRWLETVYDQHTSARFPRGRPWWGNVEQPAEQIGIARPEYGFISLLMPGDHNEPLTSSQKSWEAPWYPDQVISASPGPGITTFRIDTRRLRLTWNYQAIANYDRQALDGYYQAAAKIAHQHGWPMPKRGDILPQAILDILGDPPRSPKIAEAAMAGDPWLLGFTDEVNVALHALLNQIPIEPKAAVVQQVLQADSRSLDEIVAAAVAKAVAAERATFARGASAPAKGKRQRSAAQLANDEKMRQAAAAKKASQVIVPNPLAMSAGA